MVIPTLFGRGSVLLGEQNGFHVALRRLREISTPIGKLGVSPEAETFSIVERFRDALVDRFAAEEGEDYFGAITAIAPSLSERVAQLEREHWNLIETAAKIHDLLYAEAAPALSKHLEHLVDCLDAHERAEADLVRDFISSADEVTSNADTVVGRWHTARRHVGAE